MLAGAGRLQESKYPLVSTAQVQIQEQIRQIFQSQLKWFPSQVEKLFPIRWMNPRIFPDERVLQQVNYIEDIDWPLRYSYVHIPTVVAVVLCP
jgi:hypothetical protein